MGRLPCATAYFDRKHTCNRNCCKCNFLLSQSRQEERSRTVATHFDSRPMLSYNDWPIPAGDPLPRQPRLDLTEYFPYLVNRVGSALAARFAADALQPRRLSIAMWRVLAALPYSGGLRQIDLASPTSIRVSTLS